MPCSFLWPGCLLLLSDSCYSFSSLDTAYLFRLLFAHTHRLLPLFPDCYSSILFYSCSSLSPCPCADNHKTGHVAMVVAACAWVCVALQLGSRQWKEGEEEGERRREKGLVEGSKKRSGERRNGGKMGPWRGGEGEKRGRGQGTSMPCLVCGGHVCLLPVSVSVSVCHAPVCHVSVSVSFFCIILFLPLSHSHVSSLLLYYYI